MTTNSTTLTPRRGRNRLLTALGVTVLLGGAAAGSLAYFADATEVENVAITMGDISVTDRALTTTVNGATADLAAFKVSPGDVIQVTKPAGIEASGDSLTALVELERDLAALSSLGADVDVSFTTVAGSGAAVVESVDTPGAYELTSDGTVVGESFSADATAVITVTVPFGEAVDNSIAETVTNMSLTITATQVL